MVVVARSEDLSQARELWRPQLGIPEPSRVARDRSGSDGRWLFAISTGRCLTSGSCPARLDIRWRGRGSSGILSSRYRNRGLPILTRLFLRMLYQQNVGKYKVQFFQKRAQAVTRTPPLLFSLVSLQVGA